MLNRPAAITKRATLKFCLLRPSVASFPHWFWWIILHVPTWLCHPEATFRRIPHQAHADAERTASKGHCQGKDDPERGRRRTNKSPTNSLDKQTSQLGVKVHLSRFQLKRHISRKQKGAFTSALDERLACSYGVCLVLLSGSVQSW